MDKTPTVFLLHIRDAINQIEEYVAGFWKTVHEDVIALKTALQPLLATP